jgi:hypothetical protein
MASEGNCESSKPCYNVATVIGSYAQRVSIYVRQTKSRGAGPYFQLCESYRTPDAKTPRTRVLVHLGVHPTPEAALSAWPAEIEQLRSIGRDTQAERLAKKLETLRTLIEEQRGEQQDNG